MNSWLSVHSPQFLFNLFILLSQLPPLLLVIQWIHALLGRRCVCVCVCVCVWVCVCVCLCVCVCVFLYEYVHVCVSVEDRLLSRSNLLHDLLYNQRHPHTHIHIHTYGHTDKCAHTLKHTHTHTLNTDRIALLTCLLLRLRTQMQDTKTGQGTR